MMFASHAHLGQPPRRMIMPIYHMRGLGQGQDICTGIRAGDAVLDTFRNQGYIDPGTQGSTATTAADAGSAACNAIYPPTPGYAPMPPQKPYVPAASSTGYGTYIAIGAVALIGIGAAAVLLKKKAA